MSKLDRYIKDKKTGEKTKMTTTSVNITQDQKNFVERFDLNLSEIMRDAIDDLIKDLKDSTKIL